MRFNSKAIREARQQAGFSREQAAAQTGLAYTTVVQTEMGYYTPKLETAHRLATLYGRKVDDFIIVTDAEAVA